MASLTRSQLKTTSNSTYDTNGVGGITAAEVRTFNDDLIDSLITNDLTSSMIVLSASFASNAGTVGGQTLTSLNAFTASQDTKNTTLASYTGSNDITNTAQNNRLSNLESTSASVNISISNLNAATSSYAISSSVAAVDAAQQSQINSLIAASSSYANSASFAASQLVQDGRLNNLETTSASLLIETSNLETFSASTLTRLTNIESTTASLLIETSNLETFSASALISINALNSATSSYVTETESGSFLITASFDNGSRNLTFTKGDTTTFAVNIPDVSGSTINTGSFATTGSNSFNGNQTITGSLIQSGSNVDMMSTGPRFRLGQSNGVNFSNLTDFLVDFGGDAKFSGDNIQLEGPDPMFQLRDTNPPLNASYAMRSKDAQLQFVDGVAGVTMVTMTTASVNVNTNINISGSLTASLQEGYAWVGGTGNISKLVATSSFGGALPNNLISSSAQITALGFVSSSVTASSLVTASVNLNTITFTKGDNTTFNITVNTGSAGTTTDITALNSFTASQYVSNSFFATTASLNSYTQSTNIRLDNLETTSASVNVSISNLNSTTASQAVSITNLNAFTQSQETKDLTLASITSSLNTSASLALVTASFSGNTLTFTKGDASTFGVVIPDVSGSTLPSGVISGSAQITALGFVSSSITASSIITASVNNDDITFTKGDGSQFTISVATGSYAETSSITSNVIVIARNNNASTLGAGTVVHITSAVGDNPVFTTASFDTETLSSNTFGLLRYSSPSGADVQVVVSGIVTGVNTDPANGYVAGDILYLSSSGQFTRIQPQAPNQIVTLGQVLRAQQNNGSIYVSINNGWELNELHNVQINNPLTGDLLQYESSSYGLWKNKSIAGAGITTTASFNSYTSSNDQKVNSLIAATGSYATTGSNTFTGVNTFNDNVFITASKELKFGDNTSIFKSLDGITGFHTYGGNQTRNFTSGEMLILQEANAQFLIENKAGNIIKISGSATSIQDVDFIPFSASLNTRILASTINTGSFATTGSNSFNGNQIITGSVTISGSSTTDLTVVGQIFVSSSATGGTTAPKITVSGSAGTSTINRNSISTRNTTNLAQLSPAAVFMNVTATTDEIGFSVDASATPNWSTGPSLYINNPTDTYPAVLGFQNKANYTDGRVTVLTPLIAQSGSVITGSLIVSNTFTASLENGYAWVGNGSNVSTLVATSSFAGATINTGSFATTGSNSFVGNQIITGSVTISGSATSDLTIVGQIFVSSSVTAATTQPRITVSGSAGQSIINRNNITTRNTSNIGALNPAVTYINTIATADEIGFSVDTGGQGFAGWTTGPGIYINNPTDTYPVVFGFQNKANYTDGRVAVLTPLSASAGFTASLQNGYAWVGNSLGQNTQVATSSFGTAINTGSFATTGSNQFNGNQTITGSIISVDRSGNDTNTIIGLNALGMGSAGASPLAVGNTISVAIGQGAMRFASGSNQNIAIGNNALLVTTGSKNFAMGSEALSSNTTGQQNIGIGTSALTKNTIGESNVAIGDSAGFNVSGSQNTFVGASSGYNISGSNNTILGRYQGSAGQVLNNNIILADGNGTIKAQYSGSAWSLQDGIKLNVGTDKPADIVSVLNGNATVNNSLATTSSIILLTTQETLGGSQYPAIVDSKTNGSFDIRTNQSSTIKVAYLIINPTT